MRNNLNLTLVTATSSDGKNLENITHRFIADKEKKEFDMGLLINGDVKGIKEFHMNIELVYFEPEYYESDGEELVKFKIHALILAEERISSEDLIEIFMTTRSESNYSRLRKFYTFNEIPFIETGFYELILNCKVDKDDEYSVIDAVQLFVADGVEEEEN